MIESPIPTPPRSRQTLWIVALSVALLIALCVVLITLTAIQKSGHGQASGKPSGSSTPVQAAATEVPTTEPTTEPTPGPTLKAADLELTPKVTKKQCFGSAGCNVTVQVKVGYGGPDLDPDDTWEVTYQITGDESGPVIGTLDLTGDKYDVNEVDLSTRSSKTPISIKVTDVSKDG